MSLDVGALRRRPPGSRLLIALDQSTLSDLALDDRLAPTRELLLSGAQIGRLVCPMSPGATDETLGAGERWKAISDLHEDLSMGINFREPKDIRQRETFAAAAAFCGLEPVDSVAEEAFDRDPHTPRDELFPGGIRIIVRTGPARWQGDEVAHEKDKEDRLQQAYEAARASGVSYEQQAAIEYEAMVRWVLGPLADENFSAKFERKKAAAVMALAKGDRDGVRRWEAVNQRSQFANSLLVELPALANHAVDFASSQVLANMPALQYPALLRAGIAVRKGRLAKRGDGYDINHLTNGLSRCDVVTADASMAQLARDHKLVPPGCRLFSSREMDGLHEALVAALTNAVTEP